MNKVVIDARTSGTSTGRYVDKLIEYLGKIPTEFTFIVLVKPPRLGVMKKIAPNFKVVATPYKEFTFSEQIDLKKQIEEFKPDLVFFTMIQQPIFYRGKVVTNIQDLTTLRYINPTKNQAIMRFKKFVYSFVIRIAARKSKRLITISNFVKQDIVNYTKINPDKITVTYEAGDSVKGKEKPVEGLKGKDFIFYVGRAFPHKNLSRLIDAFKLLSESNPDLILTLVGKKDKLYELIDQKIKKENVKNVIFTDFISDGQLKWMYKNCRAYIFPSLSEGFGLPGLEAMVEGAPVVSSNATCLPEVYGDAARYFDPYDVSDMANAIEDVINSESLRHSLVQKGYLQAKKYSWKDTAEQTLEVFRSALS